MWVGGGSQSGLCRVTLRKACLSVYVVLVLITQMSGANWLLVDGIRLAVVLLLVEGCIKTNSVVRATGSRSQ
jgi:hypothetical protein